MPNTTYSVEPSKAFSDIRWNTFHNRPLITKNSPRCMEAQWFTNARCCIDGYTIEHANDLIGDAQRSESPEGEFLAQYPCVNGKELDLLVARAVGIKSDAPRSTGAVQAVWKFIAELFAKVTG